MDKPKGLRLWYYSAFDFSSLPSGNVACRFKNGPLIVDLLIVELPIELGDFPVRYLSWPVPPLEQSHEVWDLRSPGLCAEKPVLNCPGSTLNVGQPRPWWGVDVELNTIGHQNQNDVYIQQGKPCVYTQIHMHDIYIYIYIYTHMYTHYIHIICIYISAIYNEICWFHCPAPASGDAWVLRTRPGDFSPSVGWIIG